MREEPRLPPHRKLVGILPVLACFLTAAWHMRYDWTYDASYTYGWLVPPLALYLFSLRWRDRPPPSPGPPPRTLPLWITLACLLPAGWIVREANPEWRLLSIFFSGISVTAALLCLTDSGGKAWTRHFSGAVVFFMACVPWPSVMENAATGLLMPANASVTLEALQWMNIPAIRRGNLISLASGTLGVEEACSGIRSLQSVIMIAWFAGELQGLRWKARCALLVTGIVTALLTNIFRTIFLSVTAARSGLAAANAWHDTAGMVALAVNIAVILMLAGRISRKNRAVATGKPRRRAAIPPVILPLRGPMVLAAGLVPMLPLTEWWYHRKEVSPVPPWHLEKPSTAASFHELPVNDRTISMLRYSGGWSARWESDTGKPLHGFYFYWKPGRVPPENMNVHRPGGCLANLGIEFVEELEPLSLTIGGLPRTLRVLLFKDGTRPLHVLYFVDENAGHSSESPGAFDFGYQNRFAAVIHGRRNPGQRFIEVGLWDEPSSEVARATFTRLVREWVRDGDE